MIDTQNAVWPSPTAPSFPKMETTRFVELHGSGTRFYLTSVRHKDGGSYVALKATVEGVGTKNVVSICRSSDGAISLVIDEGICAELANVAMIGGPIDEA